MFKTILVPTDGSPLADQAINAAVQCARETGGRVIGLSVAEPYPFTPLSASTFSEERALYDERAREVAQEHVRKIEAAAHVLGVPCKALVTQSFSPSDEIVETAERLGCDAIFMASHGRKGLGRLFIGSETQKVLAATAIPVMVFRQGDSDAIR
ncbi:MAG TPA: universal stress protein [Noviherbaspirillum sp.]|uniref:universal stress protein n=1 Tax=Noviherbaspirillum sp. TaxID=1926288 RepID=UPI002D4599F7|nr:universal stress protein [Noviherbaspirillum sp.]HYD94460.1 universal stress protein [Noviherbaspirillum sp.]